MIRHDASHDTLMILDYIVVIASESQKWVARFYNFVVRCEGRVRARPWRNSQWCARDVVPQTLTTLTVSLSPTPTRPSAEARGRS